MTIDQKRINFLCGTAIIIVVLFTVINWGLNKAEENAVAKATARIEWQQKVKDCFAYGGLIPDVNCLL